MGKEVMMSLKWFIIGGLAGLFIFGFIKELKEIAEISTGSLEDVFILLEEEGD